MIRYFAGHPTAANLLMILLIAVGLVGLPQLQRETFPDFSADIVQVSVVYPGASAEAVEEALCRRIEDAVDGLTDIDEVRCEAREALATATIEMVAGGDMARFLSEVKTEVEAIDSFPEEIETPVVRQLNLTEPVVSIAVTGPMSEPHLKVYAEDVKDRLIRLPEVSQVGVGGFSERQIRIALDAVALRRYGLSVAEVAELIAGQNVDLPAGTIETEDRDILIRFAEERRSPLGYADLVILGGETGAELRLGQIARITDRFEQDEERVLFNGTRAALLEVSKTKTQDTLEVMAAVRAFLEEERQRAPPGVDYHLTRDVASIVQDRLDLLMRNGAQGLVLVFLVLWLFFSLRLSFWVVLSLPVSFLGTLFVMTLLGLSINMLSMVGLLIAIGLLMDDSIVIAENIARHRSEGASPIQAAVDGTREVAGGVLSSFATSVCVFAPLAFLEGDIGTVLRVMPVVLILTLAISLIEAFLILPHHLAHAASQDEPRGFRRRFEAGFSRLREHGLGRLVDAAVGWRYLTFGVLILLFLVSVAQIAGGALRFQPFPELDGNVVEARILFPQGTPLERTEQAVERVAAALERVDDHFSPLQPGGRRLVRNVLAQYNTNPDAFEAGPHLATVTADLLTAEERTGRLDTVLQRWREEVGTIPGLVSLTFKEPVIGPAGLPIDIRLTGEDLDQLKGAAQDLIAWLGRFPGVTDLQDDLRPGKPELRLTLRDGAATLGVDASLIAGQLRAAFQGRTAAEIQVGPESFEIDAQLMEGDQDSLADIDTFVITLPDGRQVPLSAVAEVERARGVARIARIDGQRTVTVRGEVDPEVVKGGQVLAVTQRDFLPELRERYPDVEIGFEGEAEEQSETGDSLRRSFLLGLLGIFLLLSFQFRNYAEPLIVMMAIPLALIGVVWGHRLLGFDLSMPSVMGFASLAGIVVNDSILLVGFVKRYAAPDGRFPFDAVRAARAAARARFRAVLLTSLTTVAGIAPLMLEQSLQAQVLVPLVVSLGFGLVASTVLVLVALPALYAILDDLGLTTVAREAARSSGAPSSGAAAAGEA